jgi:hypothetical protein
MKKFCAIYLGTQAGMEKWKKLDDATRKQREQQGMKAWQDWATKNKAAIVEMGSPLGKTKRADPSRMRRRRSCSRITRTSRSSPARPSK